MNSDTFKLSVRERIRWWLYDICFTYCVRCIFPDADPTEFTILDNAGFIAVEKDEIREIIEEAPDIAWRFESRLEEAQP